MRAIAGLLMLATAATAPAQTAPPRKMPPIYVIAEDDTPNMIACGVSNAKMKAAVEAHLRSVGIAVAQREDYTQGRALALYIDVGVARAPAAVCAASLKVKIYERVPYKTSLMPIEYWTDAVYCEEGGLGITNQKFEADMPTLAVGYTKKCLTAIRPVER